EGLPKMAWLQAIEGRRFKRPHPWREQRIQSKRVSAVHGTAFRLFSRTLHCGIANPCPDPIYSSQLTKDGTAEAITMS
ncbi:MAG: hypothetical protein L0Y50_03645, partial [Beijerinckiaceae bacterium]|nr:hypothetical protein [Beijerinckiaceae bacterium]